jgi:hypothetical protein
VGEWHFRKSKSLSLVNLKSDSRLLKNGLVDILCHWIGANCHCCRIAGSQVMAFAGMVKLAVHLPSSSVERSNWRTEEVEPPPTTIYSFSVEKSPDEFGNLTSA